RRGRSRLQALAESVAVSQRCRSSGPGIQDRPEIIDVLSGTMLGESSSGSTRAIEGQSGASVHEVEGRAEERQRRAEHAEPADAKLVPEQIDDGELPGGPTTRGGFGSPAS